jgi:ribokinase
MDINEIAKLAGVSPSTVSKVVNHKDASISDQTRERVKRVVRKYHYVPHAHAHAPREWLIAVIFRSHVSLDSTLDGILADAQDSGYSTLVFNSNSNPDQERQNIEAALQSSVGGVIWEPVENNSLELLSHLESGGRSVVTIGTSGGDQSLLIPYETAGHQITQELVSRGHSQIVCLVREGRRTRNFIDGYKRCLFENGILFQDSMVEHGISSSLLSKISCGDVTGIVCSHFLVARELQGRLTTMHYHTPEDVSLVSLRNDTGSLWTEDTDGSISTYTIRNSDFGRLAFKRLLTKMQGNEPSEEFSQDFFLDNENSIGAPSTNRAKHVVVIGSINMDTHVVVPHLPSLGTTISTHSTAISPGGKGVNQSVGIARLGFRASLIGNVGSDSSGDAVFRQLDDWAIDSSGVHRIKGEKTGQALIFVDSAGESSITILAGANTSLSASDITSRSSLFEGAQLCLIQTEIPMDAVRAACRISKMHHIQTMLKPAACIDLPDDIISQTDYLIPNREELDAICKTEGSFEEKSQELIDRGARNVIVTLGADGCYLRQDGRGKHFPAADFKPVDTTGGADAFISAFAASTLDGDDIETAISRANYAAGFSTTTWGVANSLIDRSILDAAFPSV